MNSHEMTTTVTRTGLVTEITTRCGPAESYTRVGENPSAMDVFVVSALIIVLGVAIAWPWSRRR